MKRLALVLALSAPLAALAGESGLVVFHGKCTRCHGADGRGKAIFSTPSMLTSKLSAADMELVIANGRAKMPAFKAQLSPDEVKAVATFIKTELKP
jgi:mono/diheme cytochrome c family protein